MKSNTGCLLIHGFGGNTRELEPMAEFLGKRGLVTKCPELKGHTGIRRDFAESSYKEWISSAEEGLYELKSKCSNIIIVGFSMGGLIGINLALKHKTIALATLSTPVFYLDKKMIVNNFKKEVKNICKNLLNTNVISAGSSKANQGTNNIQNYIRAIRTTPVSAFLNFRVLVKETIPVIGRLNCPIFIAQGLKDEVVVKKSADYLYSTVSSQEKTIKYYENSSHWICCDRYCRSVFYDFYDFISDLSYFQKNVVDF